MLSGIMSDPNVSALFQSMKKAFGGRKQTDSDELRSLLAFTLFYSSSIYALLLCFYYRKRNSEGGVEQFEESGDTE